MFTLKARTFADIALGASLDALYATTDSELIELDCAVFELQGRIERVLRARGLETCWDAYRDERDTRHATHAPVPTVEPHPRTAA